MLELKISQLVNSIESEYRIPVLTAWRLCSGNYEDFAAELESLAWDYPDFDFQALLERVNA